MVYEKNIYYAECAGEERGREEMGWLCTCLVRDGRYDDVPKVAEDKDYFEMLLEEYKRKERRK